MLSSTLNETIDLMNKWKEEANWLAVHVRFSKPELHEFWAKVKDVSASCVWLEGEFALLEIPFSNDSVFAYLDGRSVPPEIKQLIPGEMSFCFTIRSSIVAAFFLGAVSQND